MDQPFDPKPIRAVAPRGMRTPPMRRARPEPWPPPDRDPADAAVLAAQLLALSGRLSSRLRAATREHDVDPYLFRFLLLFADSKRALRIGNVAELLGVSHATASRTAHRAHAAGLVDKFPSAVDGREVTVRLTATGRAAVTQCLDALRPLAREVLGPVDQERADAARAVLRNAARVTSKDCVGGWRAGVRVGMWENGDGRFRSGQ
jgi:DNA-binding MarR family transcriptional regulator